MKVSDAISILAVAEGNLREARTELEDAQNDCDGTWGYYLTDNYDAVEAAEKSLEEAKSAIDESIVELIKKELSK